MMSRPKSWLLASFLAASWNKQLVHHVGVEDVDAHRGEHLVGLAGHARRVLGLLQEARDTLAVVDPHDAELARLQARHRQAGDRQVGPVVAVVVDHPGVVHLVDVVAGQDQRIAGRGLLDGVDVLVDRVGRPLIPHLGDPLLGRDHLDVLVQLAAEELPPLVDVPVQADGLVLRQDEDLAKVGVDAVRQREIDDPVDAAERDRRLGTVPGQGLQTRSPAPGQHDGQHVTIHQKTSARLSARQSTALRPMGGPAPLCAGRRDKPTALVRQLDNLKALLDQKKTSGFLPCDRQDPEAAMYLCFISAGTWRFPSAFILYSSSFIPHPSSFIPHPSSFAPPPRASASALRSTAARKTCESGEVLPDQGLLVRIIGASPGEQPRDVILTPVRLIRLECQSRGHSLAGLVALIEARPCMSFVKQPLRRAEFPVERQSCDRGL